MFESDFRLSTTMVVVLLLLLPLFLAISTSEKVDSITFFTTGDDLPFVFTSILKSGRTKYFFSRYNVTSLAEVNSYHVEKVYQIGR